MSLRRTTSSRSASSRLAPARRRRTITGRARVALLVPSAALLVLGVTACNDVPAERPAAEVDGTEISADEVKAGIDALAANEGFVGLASGPQSDGTVLFEGGKPTPAMERLWLGLLIQRQVVAAEFEARDATLGAKDEATANAEQFFGGAKVFKDFPKAFQDAAIADQQRRLGLVEVLGDLPVSDAEVQAAYEQRYGAATCPTGKSVAHILVEDDKAAQAVLDELAEGGDFAALAKERSTDPGSGPNGGELGCLVEGQFVPEFEQAALDAPMGEPVGPVKTEFGSHVIVVTPYEVPTLGEVEDQLRAELEQAAQQADPVSRLLVQDLSTQEITIDPEIGTFDKATLSVIAAGKDDEAGGDGGEGSTDGEDTGPGSSGGPVVRDGR